MKTIFERLYDSEINFAVNSFCWCGFDVNLGDDMNGFKASTTVDTWAEVEQWLEAQARLHFPNSVFALSTGATMTDITIPTVALEAAARAMWRTDEPSQWELGMADIALRAGVNAWPGRSQFAENDSASIREMACFILPLPKEKTND